MNLFSMRLLNSLLKKSCVVIMIMALCILCGCAASESRSEYGIFIGVDPDDLPEDMKDYDIIVIDAQNFTRGQIQKFKNNGQKVYSYINAGSIEKTRSYYGKYADLTLDPYENWDEEYWVDVSSEKWQDFISYDLSQKLLDKDIDGFFVDNIDIYYQYPRPEIYNGLCNILNNLMDYDKPVIVNGGDVFVSEYISRNGNIKDILTGINQETVFSKINFDQETFEKNDEDTIEYFKKYIEECKSNGLDVYITEYTTDKKLIRQIKDYCKENGFHYYISDSIQLD